MSKRKKRAGLGEAVEPSVPTGRVLRPRDLKRLEKAVARLEKTNALGAKVVDRLAQAQQIVVSEVGMLRGQLSMGAAVERALNRGGDGAVVAHLTGPRAGSITIPALAKPRVLERK